MASTTFQVNLAWTGNLEATATVTIEEIEGGLNYKISLDQGDLYGFFFNVADDTLWNTLSIVALGSTTITAVDQDGNVGGIPLSPSNNMNGGFDNPLTLESPDYLHPNFEVGIQFGPPGSSSGLVQYVEFNVLATGLTLDDVIGELAGVRIQSTTGGPPDDDSDKALQIVPPPPPPPPPQWEGLSHGYWKNHVGDWDTYNSVQITTTTSFEGFFRVDGTWVVGTNKKGGQITATDVNFMKALDGPAYGSAQNILAMQAVAAVLNALDEDINYEWSVEEIVAEVQAAWNSTTGRDAAMLDLAAKLDAWNNLGDIA